MKNNTPAAGGICESLQGRDKGRFYIITGVNPDGTIFVADGNFKKLAAPKKKNIKHLRLLPEKAEAIGEKLLKGDKVFDSEIYSALKTYNCPKKAEEV